MRTAADAIEAAADDITAEDLDGLQRTFSEAEAECTRTKGNLDAAEARERAVGSFREVEVPDEPQSRSVPIPVSAGPGPAVYRRDNQHSRSFFADMYSGQFRDDSEARGRLAQNAQENHLQRRDVSGASTGSFTGLVIPQYLVDLYAPYLRAGRIVANEVRSLPLPPEGMVFNISRLTTATSAAIQATENANVSETLASDTLLAVNVRTIAGQQDVSRQLLERGTPGIDELLYQDLLMAYAQQVDAGVISGTGNSGTIKGIMNSGPQSVTWTEGSPTVAKAWPSIANAVQKVAAARFMPATKIFMHPRRWGWILAALDSTNRPLVVPDSMAWNAAGEQAAFGEGAVGTLQGLPVFVDANIPTNVSVDGSGNGGQDPIIVSRAVDNLLWEEGDGTPRQARFEQTLGNQLTIKLVIYGYVAFTAERYSVANCVISGTGLVVPSF
jgi:HK97 family phage major capsid protein